MEVAASLRGGGGGALNHLGSLGAVGGVFGGVFGGGHSRILMGWRPKAFGSSSNLCYYRRWARVYGPGGEEGKGRRGGRPARESPTVPFHALLRAWTGMARHCRAR